MAEYVVVDKEQLEADLTTVADSIRAKGGTTEALEFPLGMKSAVESIQTGITKPEQEKSVTITENGTTEVTPDEGKVLSKVTVNTNVESGGGSDTLALRLKNELTEYQINDEIDLGDMFFKNCSSIIKFSAPLLKSVGVNCFNSCEKLSYVDLGNIKNLINSVLYACSVIKTVVLRSSTMCTLSGKINSTYANAGETFFYVPRVLVEEYKVATNWTNYVNQFRALEDYTVDGTITGAFDESKI